MVELIELVKMFLLFGFIAFYNDLKDFLWAETFMVVFLNLYLRSLLLPEL
jgi:hypothetical protein